MFQLLLVERVGLLCVGQMTAHLTCMDSACARFSQMDKQEATCGEYEIVLPSSLYTHFLFSTQCLIRGHICTKNSLCLRFVLSAVRHTSSHEVRETAMSAALHTETTNQCWSLHTY